MSIHLLFTSLLFSFFFNDTATTEIYTLSLHDALPILLRTLAVDLEEVTRLDPLPLEERRQGEDRKSTRLNSSHTVISYAVFCLKKKKTEERRSNLCPWTPPPRSARDLCA